MSTTPQPSAVSRRALVVRYCVMFAVCWIVLAALAWSLDPILQKGVPREMSDRRQYTLIPHSKRYELTIERMGVGMGSPWLPHPTLKADRGMICLAAGDSHTGASEFHFDLDRGRVYFIPHPPFSPTALDQATLVNWIALRDFGAGGDKDVQDAMIRWAQDPQLREEMAEVLALVTTRDLDPAHEPPLTRFTVQSKSVRQYDPVSPERALWVNVIWIVLGLTATTMLWRRARRELQRSSTSRGFAVLPTQSTPPPDVRRNLPPIRA